MSDLELRYSDAPVDNPRIESIRKRPIDYDAYRHPEAKGNMRAFRNATLRDVSRLYYGNWLFYDEDVERVVLAYLTIPDDCSPLIPKLLEIKWTVSSRNDGTPSKAKTVGFLERNPIRQRDFCRIAGLANENPAAHAAVLDYAAVATEHYRRLNPQLYDVHMDKAKELLDQYRVAGTPFTSGIVNRDNVLPYHYDAGNIREVWSLMLGFKKDIVQDEDGSAGELVIPEYDMALAIEDNTLSGFDGQVALHGVTPFAKGSRNAYRFTIVYYAKAGMWRCLSLDDEVKRAQQQRTAKEFGRYDRGRARGS